MFKIWKWGAVFLLDISSVGSLGVSAVEENSLFPLHPLFRCDYTGEKEVTKMAVQYLTNTSLQLVFQAGTDMDTGKPILKYKSFNNVKTDATADKLFAAATAIADLQEHPLYNIVRRDQSEIRDGE